jgi:DNA-binding Xre family transcriptional regulator
LFKEILKNIKKKKQKTVKQKKKSVGLQFLVIDNIWDVLISKKKNLALELMLIIIHGPSAGYHTIIGSSLSYRNLLEQVIAMHPMLIKELESQFDSPVPKRIDEICDELIYTPDDLVYYKKANSFVLDKYYKI